MKLASGKRNSVFFQLCCSISACQCEYPCTPDPMPTIPSRDECPWPSVPKVTQQLAALRPHCCLLNWAARKRSSYFVFLRGGCCWWTLPTRKGQLRGWEWAGVAGTGPTVWNCSLKISNSVTLAVLYPRKWLRQLFQRRAGCSHLKRGTKIIDTVFSKSLSW